MGRGIDYGLGMANVDKETGIRYGVIPVHAVEWWHDSAEADYGDPTCPSCGGDVIDSTAEDAPDEAEEDFYCSSCEESFSSDETSPESPVCWYVKDEELFAHTDGEGTDIFVIKSPYFTRAAFCSPCAPGACYLTQPCDDGARAYCLGHDWFDGDKAPYPVYRVDTGERVLSAQEAAEIVASKMTEEP